MSEARLVLNNIYSVSAIDWNRRYFDEIVKTPEGTTYNSYIVCGSQKTALIDTVDKTKIADLMRNIENLRLESIDYIIANHAEQDHSGAIPYILEKYPDAKVVTNLICKELLKDFHQIPDNKFMEVKDGDVLSLGDKTLTFIKTPWVHWPDTQCTYIMEDKILFSCDFFGAHYASSDLFVSNLDRVLMASKNYFAEIMMPFRSAIRSNLDKLDKLDIGIIAPSHGPIHNNPKYIKATYREWSSEKVKNKAIIPYVSMHESTQIMAEYLADKLIDKGVEVDLFDLSKTETGKIATSLLDSATLLIGSPTFLTGAHPLAAYIAFLTNALRPKLKYAGIFGSYGWGSKMVDQIKLHLSGLTVEMFEPIIAKGYPKPEVFASMDKLVLLIQEKHKML